VPGFPGVFFMTVDGFDPKAAYAVTGTPIISLTDRDGGVPTRTFELVEPDDALQEALKRVDGGVTVDDGFAVRVIADDLKTGARGFNVEVSDYSKVAEQ
jgi:hypothetical protein